MLMEKQKLEKSTKVKWMDRLSKFKIHTLHANGMNDHKCNKNVSFFLFLCCKSHTAKTRAKLIPAENISMLWAHPFIRFGDF